MKKRLIVFSLATMVTTGMLAGCSGNASSEKTTSAKNNSTTTGGAVNSAKSKKYDKEITVKVVRNGDVRVVDQDLFAPILKEKFNMVLEVTDINKKDFVTKLNLAFASGEQPDVNISQRPEYMLNEWVDAGYLRGSTVAELKEKLPHYVSQYTDEEWKSVWAQIKSSNDKAYYLPSRRADVMNMAWMYRKDTFDEMGLKFPETTDGLLEAMRAIKTKTGRIPFVSASSDNVFWAFTGFLQAFGIPELAPRDLSYVDPISGEFVPYAFVTDAFREHTKFMSKLFKEGLIWQEFTTGTTDQINAMKSKGNGYITWGYPDKIETEYNRLSKNADPNAKWDWSRSMLSSNPQKGTYYKAGPYQAADGVAFSVDAKDEVVDRFMDYMDWMHTDEGLVLRTYGVEGVTYTKKGDNYLFMDQMASPIKSEGKTLMNYGIVSIGMQHPNLNSYYKPYLTELEKTFMNRKGYYFHTAPVLTFSTKESSELADIATSLNQTGQEYYSKFIMGHIDIENDKEWENYISTMKKLGLDKFKEIRTAAYKRSNNVK
jgi:putative aldouronate transport system substrate-binding protein